MHLVSETRPQVKRDRLLRLPEVEALTGLKKSTLYLLMKRVPAELLEPMVGGVSLDCCLSSTGGVYRGTNYVLIGDPGVGKSTITMEYAAAHHAQGKKVLRIEAEMTRIDMEFAKDQESDAPDETPTQEGAFNIRKAVKMMAQEFRKK
jgi:Mrp family chromosome partitioning ATPase